MGVLNSSPVWRYGKARFSCPGDEEKGGRLRFIFQSVITIPVPEAPAAQKAAISALVQRCLDAKGVGCEKWEEEINERVAALYWL